MTRRKRSIENIAAVSGYLLLAALVLALPRAAQADGVFKVGSFTKSTTTGNQVVAHGLGVTPKAIIFWSEARTNTTFGTSRHTMFGATDGTTDKSTSAASQDAAGTSNASRRIATKAITFVEWGEVTLAEADRTAWDSTNFTLNWTTNNATAYVIHFIAMGGTDISAKVIEWTVNTVTGNQSIAGVGFKPVVVLHSHAGAGFISAVPASQVNAAFDLGAMDAGGSQWANSTLTVDNAGTSDTQRYQRVDRTFVAPDNGLGSQKDATFVSMDADGFTVNWSNIGSLGLATKAFSIALTGLNAKVGNFNKTTTTTGLPVSQAVTGTLFQPAVVMLTSVQDTARTAPVAHDRFGFGASDGTTQGSIAFQDTNGSGTTSVDDIQKTDKIFIKVNNNGPAIEAEASLTSMDTDGFTLSWTTNDAVATEILYLALGSLSPTAVRLSSFTAATTGQSGIGLGWHTGYEVNNLGFHVYRDDQGRMTRLTRELVAGTALMVGAGTVATAGHAYSWFDPDGTLQDRYWLEDVDLNGTRTVHGPVAAEAFAPTTAKKILSGSISEFTKKLGERYDDFWRAADLKSKLPRRNFATDTSAPLGFERMTAAARQDRVSAQIDPATPADLATQQSLAGRAAVKISVKESAWYRAAAADLIAAGLRSGANPSNLRLYTDGREVPIKVVTTNNPRLGTLAALEFYGQALDTIWTDSRVYWLIEDARAGKRIDELRPGTGGNAGAPNFPFTVERKDRTFYFAALKNGEAESFFGPLITTEEVDQVLSVQNRDAASSQNALLEVRLQGLTNLPHRVTVRFNETEIGEVAFDGQTHATVNFALPNSALLDGDNVVTLVSSDATDIALIDRIRLTYAHTYSADNDQLRFTAAAGTQLTVGGFSQATLRIVDITDPANVREVIGTVQANGASYGITFQVPGQGIRTLHAFSAAQVKPPVAVIANQPSTWHAAAAGAELAIISHGDFLGQANNLKALRQSQGISATVIDVGDLYDEFSFGVKSPHAIKDFLSSAKSKWKVAPRFVLLVGDASFDPKNYLGFGKTDLLPTKLVETTFLKTASDDWFVDFNNDGLPDLAVGRLPARSIQDAITLVNKILSYEGAASHAPRALLVADRNDDFDFKAASEQVGKLLPAAYHIERIYRDDFASDGAAQSALIAELNRGAALVNFVGHGSVEVLSAMLSSADAQTLTNGAALPFFISMTCLNGFFHDVFTESLAEALLKAPHGGALAVWASSALTEPQQQAQMNREITQLLFSGNGMRLGEAAMRAKAKIADPDIRRSWMLFGDPTLKLK